MEEQEEKEHHEEHEHPEHHENHEKKEHHENHEHHEKEHEHHHEQHEKKEHEQKQNPEPSGEKKDLRDSRISILLFTLAGAATALLSSILKSSGLSNYITVALGFVVLVALLLGMQKAFRRRIKFFYASLFIYLLVWLVSWIFLFNM